MQRATDSTDTLRVHEVSPPSRNLELELAPAILDACRSLWREFAELSSLDPYTFSDQEHELLRWYAELNFRLGTGGGRCVECNAHVRHALPIRAETLDGSMREFLCLCTRCLVAVEYDAIRIWYVIDNKPVEHPVRGYRAYRQAA